MFLVARPLMHYGRRPLGQASQQLFNLPAVTTQQGRNQHVLYEKSLHCHIYRLYGVGNLPTRGSSITYDCIRKPAATVMITLRRLLTINRPIVQLNPSTKVLSSESPNSLKQTKKKKHT